MPLELALLLNVPPTGVMPALPSPELVDVLPVSVPLLELPASVEALPPVLAVPLPVLVPALVLVLVLEPLELVVSPRPVAAGIEPVVAPDSGEYVELPRPVPEPSCASTTGPAVGRRAGPDS